MQTKHSSIFNYNNGFVPAGPVRAISAIAAIPAVLATVFANMELCVFHYLHAENNQFQQQQVTASNSVILISTEVPTRHISFSSIYY